jgi:hypothetical protein
MLRYILWERPRLRCHERSKRIAYEQNARPYHPSSHSYVNWLQNHISLHMVDFDERTPLSVLRAQQSSKYSPKHRPLAHDYEEQDASVWSAKFPCGTAWSILQIWRDWPRHRFLTRSPYWSHPRWSFETTICFRPFSMLIKTNIIRSRSPNDCYRGYIYYATGIEDY